MSIVIPAGHLARTVITVRCNPSYAAPHIECALDEQASFGNTPREATMSPHTFASSGRATPSSSAAPPSPSGFANPPLADLSVERGMDHRGHFVRLSFLSGHRASCSYGQRPMVHENNDSCFSLANGLSGPAPNIGSSQEASSFRTSATYSSQSSGGSPLAYSSMPIMSNMPGASAESGPECLEHMDFMCPSDVELMTALDSFMGGIFDSQNTDYPMLDADVPGNLTTSRHFTQISEPASPDTSCSSPISSCSNSPTTPYDFFLPVGTPTTDGGCGSDIRGAMGGKHAQGVSEQSPQRSPVLPQLLPGPDVRTRASSKPVESRLLPCPQPGCKRQFKSTSTLGGHMKTHAGKGTRFPCSFPPCTEKFSRRHDQLRHEVYKHGKRCEWVCSRCNSFFSYERSLEKHTCTMDKSRRGSIPYAVTGSSGSGNASGTER